MTIKVRPIEAHEWQKYRSIRLAALLDTPSAFARTYDEESAYADRYWIDAARERSNGPLSGMFVAVDSGGKFVGMAGGHRPKSERQPLSAELVSMWVAPAGRRRGLGQSLIASVLQWASERGCARVDLWVTQGNDPAIELYRQAGFVETGDVEALPSDPCKDELRMRYQLS